jgi:hypothetical protein
VERAVASGAPLTTGRLALDGRGLMEAVGAGPGPHVREGLEALLDVVLDEPERNTVEALRREARAWWSARRAAAGR